MKRFFSVLPLLLCVLQARASIIDVTGETSHVLETGKTLVVQFGVWNYGLNNRDFSPFPTTIGLTIIGTRPASAGQSVPDSSATYFPGFVFEAYLESLDGSISVPLFSSVAATLGLPDGHLVLTPGTTSAGGEFQQVGVVSGTASMTLETSQQLFGSNLNNYNNAAQIRVVNGGEAFTLGMGGLYSVGQSISEPGIRGLGPAQTAGIPGRITVYNPEPSTAVLLALPVGALAWLRFRRRKSNSGLPN